MHEMMSLRYEWGGDKGFGTHPAHRTNAHLPLVRVRRRRLLAVGWYLGFGDSDGDSGEVVKRCRCGRIA